MQFKKQHLTVDVVKQKSHTQKDQPLCSPLTRTQTEGIRNEDLTLESTHHKRSLFAKQKKEPDARIASAFSDVQEEEEKQPKQDQAMEVDEEEVSNESHIVAFDNVLSSKFQIKHQGYGIMKGEQIGVF